MKKFMCFFALQIVCLSNVVNIFGAESKYYYYDNPNETNLKEQNISLPETSTLSDIIYAQLTGLFTDTNATSIPKNVKVDSVYIIENRALVILQNSGRDYGGTFYEEKYTDQIVATILNNEFIDSVSILFKDDTVYLHYGKYTNKYITYFTEGTEILNLSDNSKKLRLTR